MSRRCVVIVHCHDEIFNPIKTPLHLNVRSWLRKQKPSLLFPLKCFIYFSQKKCLDNTRRLQIKISKTGILEQVN